MNVPLADLHQQYLSIKSDIDAAIQRVIGSSQFILGDAVSEFETAFARMHGASHCIAVGSGTDALHATLWAAGIRQGDVVVTTPFTFIATLEAISLAGATPALIDIDPQTFTMDPAKLEEFLVSSNARLTKAVIPVHLYGQACDMDRIHQLALTHGIQVVEDACQAHLAKFDGVFVGNFGLAACFSFYPGKNLGAFGEAGAVVTNDAGLEKNIRRLRDHGQVAKYKHATVGHNYRMDGIQGAVLGAKLGRLQGWTDRRRAIAATYRKLLHGVGDLVLPYESSRAYHVYHLFTVRTQHRDALQKYLASNHISTAIAYPIPLHFQGAYAHLAYGQGSFPQSERAAEECISLPLFAEMTDEQVGYVSESVGAFFNRS
ncbi:MAG TPA: DegT/DnrJ/EryC1/StrS family aminotransferase [Bacteroidota bacterium]|jgi:dTDP-4-amino-4,6-dideoxygalactose transaminase|nr:DegT/DnrJ/EryC1/StrS family aminotransferase [Bacteroidota bacterium]